MSESDEQIAAPGVENKKGVNIFGSGYSSDWNTEEQLVLCPTPPPYSSESPQAKTVSTPKYTIDEAIDKMGYGPFQFIIYLFCGFIWMADAMELMILAILSPAVKCQWSLSNVEEAFITSIVFIGFLFGSIFWGYISDNFGRKKAFVAMTSLVLVSGVLSALKLTTDDLRIPGYPWLLLCRFVVGFGVAGVAQASTYYIEFLPRRTRAVCTICLIAWFAFGTMFGAALAVGVMGNDKYDWHWYIGLSAIPIALVTCVVPFVPESARVLLAKGNKEGALKILKKVEWLNFRSLPTGELVSAPVKGVLDKERDESQITFFDDKLNKYQVAENAQEKEPLISVSKKERTLTKLPAHRKVALKVQQGFSRVQLLFIDGMWRTTVPLWFLWFGAAWLYYGCILLTTTMLQENPHCEGRGLNSSLKTPVFTRFEYIDNSSNLSNATSCEDEELDTGDYIKILWASAAELPGILVTIAVIEIIGRKLTIMFGFLVALLGYCLLFICTNETILTVFFSIIRASVAGLFQAMYAYTPEIYPTKIRGLGIGFASSVARLGAILTPYVAQVLFHASDYATISMYAGSCLILAIVVILLPIETKGKSLKE